MQFNFASAQNWLTGAWHHKISVLGGVLAIISLSLAHYAGFLMKVPLQIVAVAGVPLATGVTSTFLFYLFLCGIFARVFTSAMQLAVLPLLAMTDRMQRGLFRKMDWTHKRRFVRSHTETIRLEGLVWLLIQACLFFLMMLAIYVNFTITWLSGIGLLISMILVILSGLVRAEFFLQPQPRIFVKKIRSRRARSARAASAAFVTITGSLVVMAFFMGSMRATLLRDQAPHTTITNEFTGLASVVASSEGALLLYQKQGDEQRYIYSAPELTAVIETKPVFPPISSKNK